MYLKKIKPRTAWLYPSACMLLRSLSAVDQSLASKQIVVTESLPFLADLALLIGGRS